MKKISGPILERNEFLFFMIILLIVCIVFTPRGFLQVENISTFLTSITFLFGIIGGFSISRAWDEFKTVRKLISMDDSYFETVWGTVQMFDKKSKEKIRILLDKLLVLDYYLGWEDFPKTNKIFSKLSDEINSIDPKTKKQQAVYGRLLAFVSNWGGVKAETYSLGASRISLIQWTMLLTLGGLLIFGLFVMRTEGLVFDVIVFFASIAVFLIIFTIHDLDNYSFSDAMWGQGNAEYYENMFDKIGMPYFYPKLLIDKKIVKPKGKYRSMVPKDYLKELE